MWRALLLLPSLLACNGDKDDSTAPLVDADGDGSPVGEDCDDDDAGRTPGATEIDSDTVDQDCDGCPTSLDEAGDCPYATTVLATGDEPTGTLGAGMGALDLDADGVSECLVADPAVDSGAGAVSLLVAGAQVGALVGSATDAMGSAVLAADIDGDGDDDVIAGAPGAASGAGAIAYVDASGLAGVEGGDATVAAVSCGYTTCGMGASLAWVDELGSGGKDAVIIGAPGAAVDGGSASGAALALFSPLDDTGTLTGRNSASISGDDEGDDAGAASASGDVDGDGLADLIVGAPGGSTSASEGGVVGVVTARLRAGEALLMSDADAVISSAETNDRAGETLACLDYNGDGYADCAIGAPQAASGAGTVWMVYGSAEPTGTLVLSRSADMTVTTSGGGGLGASLADVGDLDEDDADELLIGAPDPSGATPGAAWLLSGQTSGTVEVSPGRPLPPGPMVTPFVGDELGDQFGAWLLGLGHYGGIQAWRDLMIAVPQANGGYGQVVVIYDYVP